MQNESSIPTFRVEAKLCALATRKRYEDTQNRRQKRGWHWSHEFDAEIAMRRVELIAEYELAAYKLEAEQKAARKSALQNQVILHDRRVQTFRP